LDGSHRGLISSAKFPLELWSQNFKLLLGHGLSDILQGGLLDLEQNGDYPLDIATNERVKPDLKKI
jgi:hypothetical protein